MKRLLLAAFIAFCCGALWASSFTSIGSLATVNNTTVHGASGVAGTLTLPGGYYLVQHQGLNNTNDVYGALEISTDNTNFTTVASYNPTATNATTDRVYMPSAGLITVYYRFSITTTNSQQVGVNFIQ